MLALKGAGTVVTDGDRLYVNPTGNPGMATGGTGDVLTGLAAGLLCQGLAPFEALQLAVFVHGLAGRPGGAAGRPAFMTAEDVLDCTPEAFQLVETLKPGTDARAGRPAACWRGGGGQIGSRPQTWQEAPGRRQSPECCHGGLAPPCP